MNVEYHPLKVTQHGILAELLQASYADLLAEESSYWNRLARHLTDFDREVFDHMETVGKSVFLTTMGDALVGFASFDPRQYPDYGVVGHHCVLPSYRRKGIGRRQIEEILSRFSCMGMREARVTTSAHPFFLAARRTYESCGFHKSRQYAGGSDPRYVQIEYVRDLKAVI